MISVAGLLACGFAAASPPGDDGQQSLESAIATAYPEIAEATAKAVSATARAEVDGIRHGDYIDTTKLRKGDCLRFETAPRVGDSVDSVQLTSCEDPESQYYVLKLVPQTDAAYPGDSVLLKRFGVCGFGLKYRLVPSQEEWELEGFRDIICMTTWDKVFDPSGELS